MRLPRTFPSFFDLVTALNSDPYLLSQTEAIVIAGTVYSTTTIFAHSDFQRAARELWAATLPPSTGTEATSAFPSDPYFPPPASDSYNPTLDEISEWLNDQAPSSSGQSAPQPDQPAVQPEQRPKQAPPTGAQFVPFNRLTEQQKSDRYKQAAQMFKAGRTVEFVQRITGISRQKLLQFRRTVLGEKTLTNLSLTVDQREILYVSLKTETPQNWGMPEPRWCARTLQALVEQMFKITINFADASVLYRHLLDARAFTPRGTTIYIESQTGSGTESQTETATSAQQTQQRYWHRSRLSDKTLRERVKEALAKGMDQKTAAALFDVKPATVKDWGRQLRAASKMQSSPSSLAHFSKYQLPLEPAPQAPAPSATRNAHDLEEQWEDIELWLSAQSPSAVAQVQDSQAQADQVQGYQDQDNQDQQAQSTSKPSPASSQGFDTLAGLLQRPTEQPLPPVVQQSDQRPFLELSFEERMDRYRRVIAMLQNKYPIEEVSIKCRVPRDKVGQIRRALLTVDRASSTPLIAVELEYLATVLFSRTPSSYGLMEGYWSTEAVQRFIWQRLNLSLSPTQVEQVRHLAKSASRSFFRSDM